MAEIPDTLNPKKNLPPPAIWKHKESGKTVRAVPWWEIPVEDTVLDLPPEDVKKAGLGDHRLKIGFLVQVGWLLENEQGCWLGVGLGAADVFEVMPDGYKKAEEKKDGNIEQGSSGSSDPGQVRA